jgi:hypothetical protein
VGDTWRLGFFWNILGVAACAQGAYERARVLFEDGLALFRGLGSTIGIAVVLGSHAHLAWSQGDVRQAGALYRESLLEFRTVGHTLGISDCLEGLAGVAHAQGHALRAIQLFGAAATVRTALGVARRPAQRAAYEHSIAAVRAAMGDGAFTTAWTSGQTLSLEQAITEALAESGGPAS